MSSILGPRRRHLPTTSSTNGVPPGTKEINAARSLENVRPGIDPDAGFTVSRAIGVAGAMLHAMLPALLSWGFTMGLIFGGCCSNVFALEAIVKEEPDIGLLVTFTQFALTTLFTWPAHFSASHPPFFLKPRAVPIARWVPNIILFFSVNLLNNLAFSYNISVPVHIILRSGGSITTMLVGFLWGRRYTRMQVFSVALLTVGIIIAAMADSRSKVRPSL
ncbi:golgi uridine diphosphate-N- acetylglucosamine transporter [Toensbergia leucococca]|nr:golgi uridine diphosphate-N- acetylglucosamine transporter [Toensbergia leucococca]